MLYCQRCACPLSGDYCPHCGAPRDEAASPYVLYDPLQDTLLSPAANPHKEAAPEQPPAEPVRLENLPQEHHPGVDRAENILHKSLPQLPEHLYDPILPSTFHPDEPPACMPDPFSDALYISLTPYTPPPAHIVPEPDTPSLAYRFILALFLLILGSLCGYLTFQYLFFPQFFSYLQNLL